MQGFCMKEYIEERAIEIAYYIIEHKATVRQTARQFGVSKSTIHKDVTERLLTVNPSLAAEVLQGSGCEQIRAAHPRRYGDAVKNIFISTNCQRQHLRQCKYSGRD